MAEIQQEHQVSWEDNALQGAINDTKRGQWLGFATAIACIAASVILAWQDRDLVAAILAGVGAVGLVGRFIQKE